MKKYLNWSLFFAIYGLAAGIFYREFTKYYQFSGTTVLGMAHAHILALGFGGFLVLALFVRVLHIKDNRKLELANLLYIIGLLLASVMMLWRGGMEVSGAAISDTLSTVISCIAGVGHLAVAVGIVRYITVLKKLA